MQTKGCLNISHFYILRPRQKIQINRQITRTENKRKCLQKKKTSKAAHCLRSTLRKGPKTPRFRKEALSSMPSHSIHSAFLSICYNLIIKVFFHVTGGNHKRMDSTVAQKCHGNFNFVHGNFNFITAISTSFTAISISPRQFQLRSRQFQFHHGNFNFTTAISISSRQFQFHHGNFNFVHGNFNFITAISISPRQFQLHQGHFNFITAIFYK